MHWLLNLVLKQKIRYSCTMFSVMELNSSLLTATTINLTWITVTVGATLELCAKASKEYTKL